MQKFVYKYLPAGVSGLTNENMITYRAGGLQDQDLGLKNNISIIGSQQVNANLSIVETW